MPVRRSVMHKKGLVAVTLIAIFCLLMSGCSFLGSSKKIGKNKKDDIDPPSKKAVISAVSEEYDEGTWEITDSDEDDGDYVWELECSDGATAVVKWSEGDDEDDLSIKIDDSGVVIETTPEPTPTPVPTEEEYTYSWEFTDADINDCYPADVDQIELYITGAEVSAVDIYLNGSWLYTFSDSDIEDANSYLQYKGGYATFYYYNNTSGLAEGDYTYKVYDPDGKLAVTATCSVGESSGTGSSGDPALNGFEQYQINDDSAGISDICWENADVEEGIAIYTCGDDMKLTFYSTESYLFAEVYRYSLVDDSEYPTSDQEYTDAKYLYDAFVLVDNGNGRYTVEWTDDSDEESMYVVVVSTTGAALIDESTFFTACFVSE